eukprot:1160010-Pelagomonas_calceolata.AAC.12
MSTHAAVAPWLGGCAAAWRRGWHGRPDMSDGMGEAVQLRGAETGTAGVGGDGGRVRIFGHQCACLEEWYWYSSARPQGKHTGAQIVEAVQRHGEEAVSAVLCMGDSEVAAIAQIGDAQTRTLMPASQHSRGTQVRFKDLGKKAVPMAGHLGSSQLEEHCVRRHTVAGTQARPKDLSKKAVLIAGPPGTGKTSTAHIISRWVHWDWQNQHCTYHFQENVLGALKYVAQTLASIPELKLQVDSFHLHRECGFNIVEMNASDTRNKADTKRCVGMQSRCAVI